MAWQIVFFGLAVMCVFSAGFAGGLGWRDRSDDELLSRSTVRTAGTMLGLGVVCLFAGAIA